MRIYTCKIQVNSYSTFFTNICSPNTVNTIWTIYCERPFGGGGGGAFHPSPLISIPCLSPERTSRHVIILILHVFTKVELNIAMDNFTETQIYYSLTLRWIIVLIHVYTKPVNSPVTKSESYLVKTWLWRWFLSHMHVHSVILSLSSQSDHAMQIFTGLVFTLTAFIFAHRLWPEQE